MSFWFSICLIYKIRTLFFFHSLAAFTAFLPGFLVLQEIYVPGDNHSFYALQCCHLLFLVCFSLTFLVFLSTSFSREQNSHHNNKIHRTVVPLQVSGGCHYLLDSFGGRNWKIYTGSEKSEGSQLQKAMLLCSLFSISPEDPSGRWMWQSKGDRLEQAVDQGSEL